MEDYSSNVKPEKQRRSICFLVSIYIFIMYYTQVVP